MTPHLLSVMLLQLLFSLGLSALLSLPSYLTLRRFLPLAPARWKRLAVWLMQGVAVFMVIWPGDPNFLLTLPFYAAILLFCSTGSLLGRCSLTLLFFSLSMAIAAFCSELNRFNDSDWFSTLLCALLWTALWLALRRWYPDDGGYPTLPSKFWLLIDLFCLLAFGALLIMIVFPLLYSYRSNHWLEAQHEYLLVQTLFLCPIIIAASTGALVAIVVLSRHERLQQAELLYEVNRAYYDQLEQTQLQVRRLRHDMANHLQTLRGLEGDALHRYLDALAQAPAFHSQRRYCENPVVNAVLQNKEALISAHQIDADLAVTLPADLPVSDLDLCALFANGLDNAIEACLRLPAASRRLSVRARADKGLLVVRIRNRTADLAPLPPDTLPPSQKSDRQHHGYGLQNLRELALRYHGSFEIQRESGMFELLVTLPLRGEKNAHSGKEKG